MWNDYNVYNLLLNVIVAKSNQPRDNCEQTFRDKTEENLQDNRLWCNSYTLKLVIKCIQNYIEMHDFYMGKRSKTGICRITAQDSCKQGFCVNLNMRKLTARAAWMCSIVHSIWVLRITKFVDLVHHLIQTGTRHFVNGAHSHPLVRRWSGT